MDINIIIWILIFGFVALLVRDVRTTCVCDITGAFPLRKSELHVNKAAMKIMSEINKI